MTTDRTVAANGVQLACQDHGGDGPPLVLMHGAGGSQRGLGPLATRLTRSHRVVTFDFRGHGGTSRVPFDFPTSLQDLQAVIDAFDLGDPAVAGHSLGGMVALLHGATHPDCPGVVNIDGWGFGPPEHHPGIDPARVTAYQDAVRAGGGFNLLGTAVVALAKRLPRARGATSAQDVALELDVLAAHRASRAPVLTFNARADIARGMRLMQTREGLQVLRTWREGIRQDLARMPDHVTVVDLPDADHSLYRTRVEDVATAIERFLLPD